jgi:hypothetical protein
MVNTVPSEENAAENALATGKGIRLFSFKEDVSQNRTSLLPFLRWSTVVRVCPSGEKVRDAIRPRGSETTDSTFRDRASHSKSSPEVLSFSKRPDPEARYCPLGE